MHFMDTRTSLFRRCNERRDDLFPWFPIFFFFFLLWGSHIIDKFPNQEDVAMCIHPLNPAHRQIPSLLSFFSKIWSWNSCYPWAFCNELGGMVRWEWHWLQQGSTDCISMVKNKTRENQSFHDNAGKFSSWIIAQGSWYHCCWSFWKQFHLVLETISNCFGSFSSYRPEAGKFIYD